VHIGDDVPDEPAFAAAEQHGGFGVTVNRRVAGIKAHLSDHNDTWELLAILVDSA
jgi:trehalose 6-phosphate phosphatase